MSVGILFEQFVEDLAKKVHNLNSDTIKIALTNTAPDPAADAIFADITEISAAFGYSAGGATATFVSGAQAGGIFVLVLDSVVFTAAGGSIGPFRYAVAYNFTASSPVKPLIGYWDYGLPITLPNGQAFTITIDGTDGVMQIGA